MELPMVAPFLDLAQQAAAMFLVFFLITVVTFGIFSPYFEAGTTKKEKPKTNKVLDERKDGDLAKRSLGKDGMQSMSVSEIKYRCGAHR